jgi:hypothetical protein
MGPFRSVLKLIAASTLAFFLTLTTPLDYTITSSDSLDGEEQWTMRLFSVAEAHASKRQARPKHGDEKRYGKKHRGKKHRSPKAKLHVRNLTRDKRGLNWIRLKAGLSKGKRRSGALYEYFVEDARTGLHLHSPGRSTASVANVLLKPGKYVFSVVVSTPTGKRSIKSVRRRIPGDPSLSVSDTPTQWGMGKKWRPGDPSLSVSIAAGPLSASDIKDIFAVGLEPPVVGATSSSGCGNMMNNAGNGISIATGMISMIPGAGPVLGPFNAASAGLKLAGGHKSSACTQAKFDAINDQLKYQESQIQEIYTIIGRDENVFFQTLEILNEEVLDIQETDYNEARNQVTSEFDRFMTDSGLWNDHSSETTAIAVAQVETYKDFYEEDGQLSPGLARCMESETACCYRPYQEDLATEEDCANLVSDSGGPQSRLRDFAEDSTSLDTQLKNLLGSSYSSDLSPGCVHDCFPGIDSSLSGTVLGDLLDTYADRLAEYVVSCTSTDATARETCEAKDNNVVELYEGYNAAIVAIYQQSLYSLQQAYSMEWLVNQFNYSSFNCPTSEDPTECDDRLAAIDRLTSLDSQKVPGAYYEGFGSNEGHCLDAAEDATEESEYTCAQEQLTLAYAQRANILYQNVLGYIVTDKPTTMQHWPRLPATINLQKPQFEATITLQLNLDYEHVVGASLGSTPKDHVGNVTGLQTDSPNSYNWSDEGILYQFSIQDIARCAHTLEVFNTLDSSSVECTDGTRGSCLETAFADPADCPSVFALPDGSPPNQGFFDGRTLQPYDQLYVSPGGGTCDDACYTCESGQDPNNTDPAPDPPIEWAEGGLGLQVQYETPAADWASASSNDNGSWTDSCRSATFSGNAGNDALPPTLCAECLDVGSSYGETNCKICPGGRWGNDNGTLFCEGTTELCRGYCSGDNFCGDSRYASGPAGDRDYTDCAKCGGDPVLALSARMPGNVNFCYQSADPERQSPYQQLLAPPSLLQASIYNYDEASADDLTMGGNKMTWFTPPASYSGNQAGLQPGTVHLTCGNWVMPPTVDEWLKAKSNGTRDAFIQPAADDTAFTQQNRSGHKAIASIAWKEVSYVQTCGSGFTKIHGPFCEWDQDYAAGVDSISATDVWKTCGKLNWINGPNSSASDASYAGFTMSFSNPATGLPQGGLPVPLGLVKQCFDGSNASGPTNVVAPFALYAYDPDTDTTTTNAVSEYGYVCAPTYIDESFVGNTLDTVRIGDIEQTLTCSLLDGSEYRVGIRRAESSSYLNQYDNETFVTVKQSNTGCPQACYDCNSGLGGTTEGGLALVIGTDDVPVCDGYCSGYNFCGGKEYNQPSVDFASVDCTRCGAGDDDGDPLSDRICAASESDRCVSAPGTDVYYGKKYVNSLVSQGGSSPGSGKVTTLDQMVNDGTATKISGAPGLVECSNDYFPRDPAVGFAKHCITSPSPSGARLCASTEGDYCACDGDVYYGKKFVSSLTSEGGAAPGDGPLTTYSQVVSEATYGMKLDVQDGIECSYTAMGGDPASGYYKHCYCVPGS